MNLASTSHNDKFLEAKKVLVCKIEFRGDREKGSILRWFSEVNELLGT